MECEDAETQHAYHTHTQTSEFQLLHTMNQQIYKDKLTYMDREKHQYHFMHYQLGR